VRHLVADIDPALDPDSVTDQQCDAIYARFLELYEQQWVAFPDVTPALTGLRLLRVPIAVLTNGPEERQQRKIGALGLGGLVDGVWTSEGIGASKPEPQAYLTVCDAMGLPPDLVLHVGDNEEFDLRGATAAGLHGVHLDRERKRPRSPDRIHHLEELCLRFA
jgi:putative hydrolase of the HAD superfamily